MEVIKYLILFLILIISALIGRTMAKKYVYRVEELEEIKVALNILKTKIRFTYEPIPEIFTEIAQNTTKNIKNIFVNAKEKMEESTAETAWQESVDEANANLNNEDKRAIKTLAKLLGQTDSEGQISQIEITEKFIEEQIQDAISARQKNEKLYTRLGTILGMTIVIILA